MEILVNRIGVVVGKWFGLLQQSQLRIISVNTPERYTLQYIL